MMSWNFLGNSLDFEVTRNNGNPEMLQFILKVTTDTCRTSDFVNMPLFLNCMIKVKAK